MATTGLQGFETAPQLHQIINRDERVANNIGITYLDQYNDAQLAKYNNEYNYWLWQQQAEYNSPANQVARAKEAGLNPNVIAGNVSSGNLNSTPESRANFKSHIFENKMQGVNVGLNAFNSVLDAIKTGVQSVSGISGIPDDISSYRKMINSTMSEGREKMAVNRISQQLENIQKSYLLFGDYSPKLMDALGIHDNRLGVYSYPKYDKIGYIEDNLSKALKESMYGKGLLLELGRKGLTNEKIRSDIQNAFKQGSLFDVNRDYKEFESQMMQKQLDWYGANKIAPWILGGAGLISKFL